jgi:hypothetical protein
VGLAEGWKKSDPQWDMQLVPHALHFITFWHFSLLHPNHQQGKMPKGNEV